MPRRLPRLRYPQPVAGIAPVADRRPPPAIVEIPVDRLREPAGKALLRPPAQLALDLRRVDRVAPVVPRPVGDEANQIAPRPPARRRHALVEQVADRLDHLKVGALLAPADLVALAHGPSSEDH